MKGDTRAAKDTRISRNEIYYDYLDYCSHILSKGNMQLCGDAPVITKASRFLMSEAEPGERFKIFPFYKIVCDGIETGTKDCKSHLRAFIKAVELLEMFCVNLFLYPWKKEIKTIQTFTGSFVYHLLPVFTSCTIQSVMASIGYLPHTDTQNRSISQYRLSEEANPDRAITVGFELLLARVECLHLLELMEQEQPGSQEWPEIIWRRAGHQSNKIEQPLGEPLAKMTEEQDGGEKPDKGGRKDKRKLSRSRSLVEREDEKPVEKELESGEQQWTQTAQVTRCAVKPDPRPQWDVAQTTSSSHSLSEDRSIIEMQRNYPDLAIRGRPLLQDNKHKASSRRNSSKAANIVSIDNDSINSKAGNLAKSDSNKSTITASAATSSNSTSKAGNMFAGDVSSSNSRSSNINGCKCSHGTTSRGSSSQSNTSSSDRSRADDVSCNSDLSGPQAFSTHTQRAETREPQTSEDKTLKTEDPQLGAESLPRAIAERDDQSSVC
ncbi:uncharacterized protein ACJ7VT_010353 isoform 2-T2 [Polymixia lowei]